VQHNNSQRAASSGHVGPPLQACLRVCPRSPPPPALPPLHFLRVRRLLLLLLLLLLLPLLGCLPVRLLLALLAQAHYDVGCHVVQGLGQPALLQGGAQHLRCSSLQARHTET
jgi:hypothetical protein